MKKRLTDRLFSKVLDVYLGSFLNVMVVMMTVLGVVTIIDLVQSSPTQFANPWWDWIWGLWTSPTQQVNIWWDFLWSL